jgi:hypothetical protein
MKKERQELHCHNCNKYVQFDIDIEQNGNHVVICPECGHEHCRVVNNGIITDVRWDSRNNSNNYRRGSKGSSYLNRPNTYLTTGITSSSASVYAVYVGNTGGDLQSTYAMYSAWAGKGQYSGGGYC